MTAIRWTLRRKWITGLALVMGASAAWSALAGLLPLRQMQPVQTQNLLGDAVTLWGGGLYALDTLFHAPIFRGADLAMLVIALPALALSLTRYLRSDGTAERVLLAAVMGIFLYQGASVSFGVVYNRMHLVYIVLFGSSLFGVLTLLADLYEQRHAIRVRACGSTRGLRVLLGITGVALIAAWVPDIVLALLSGRPPLALGVYHTSVTNVLDIGVIGPAALLALWLIGRRQALGHVLAAMVLVLGTYIGGMVLIQSAFQVAADIGLTPVEILTKAASFVVLAGFSARYALCILRSLVPDRDQKVPSEGRSPRR